MDELEYYDGQYSGPQIDDILGNSARQDAIAIVSNGNSHIAITSGQYVYVKNHGTLAEGLYKANSNISANGTLTFSNLTAVSNGVANDLKAAINNVANLLDLGKTITRFRVFTDSGKTFLIIRAVLNDAETDFIQLNINPRNKTIIIDETKNGTSQYAAQFDGTAL